MAAVRVQGQRCPTYVSTVSVLPFYCYSNRNAISLGWMTAQHSHRHAGSAASLGPGMFVAHIALA